MVSLQRQLDPHGGLVALDGAIPWETGRAHFARRADRRLDSDEIRRRAGRLEDRIAALGDGPFTLLGFSNGAIMGVALLLRRRIAFDAAVLFRPMDPGLAAPLRRLGPPVLILDGARDARRRSEDGRAAAACLTTAGAAVDRRVGSGGHGPCAGELAFARSWLAGPKRRRSAHKRQRSAAPALGHLHRRFADIGDDPTVDH